MIAHLSDVHDFTTRGRRFISQLQISPSPPNLSLEMTTTRSPDLSLHQAYGLSRPPNRVFDLDFFGRDADDAMALMKHLDLTPFSMLGWSDGGITAMHIAGELGPLQLLITFVRPMIFDHYFCFMPFFISSSSYFI